MTITHEWAAKANARIAELERQLAQHTERAEYALRNLDITERARQEEKRKREAAVEGVIKALLFLRVGTPEYDIGDAIEVLYDAIKSVLRASLQVTPQASPPCSSHGDPGALENGEPA